MKHINEYILENYGISKISLKEEKKTTGAGATEMVKTIINELSKEHPDCSWDPDEEKYTGKDAEIWFSAGKFLFDYLKELNQSDLKKIVQDMGWEDSITNINDIHPSEISLCVAQTLQN